MYGICKFLTIEKQIQDHKRTPSKTHILQETVTIKTIINHWNNIKNIPLNDSVLTCKPLIQSFTVNLLLLKLKAIQHIDISTLK